MRRQASFFSAYFLIITVFLSHLHLPPPNISLFVWLSCLELCFCEYNRLLRTQAFRRPSLKVNKTRPPSSLITVPLHSNEVYIQQQDKREKQHQRDNNQNQQKKVTLMITSNRMNTRHLQQRLNISPQQQSFHYFQK